jgi:hypothetical protein
MNVRSLVALTFVAIATLSTNAVAESDAPLGLSWGQSTTDVRNRGVDLADFSKTDFGKTFVATKLERAVSDQDSAVLSFGFNDRLWRIMIVSRKFNNDPHGTAVLARYNELLTVLSEKYGKPKQVHRLGGSIYSESKYFLAGIRGGESKWFADFDTSTLSVQLALSADDSSTGRWLLFYSNKPLEREFQSSKRTKEKGSL